MFFLDCSSLKNRLVYLVDSSSLTSSPLGRELLTLLLFSVVTSGRVGSFAIKDGNWGRWFSLQVIQGITIFWTLSCRFWCLLLLFWAFSLKYNVYTEKCPHRKYTIQWIIPKWNTPRERNRTSAAPPGVPFRSLPPHHLQQGEALLWLLTSRMNFACFWTLCKWSHTVCTLVSSSILYV